LTQNDSLGVGSDDALPLDTANQEKTNAGVARATGVLALGNIGSRALGMAREIVITGLFGASMATDAFYVATLVPRIDLRPAHRRAVERRDHPCAQRNRH